MSKNTSFLKLKNVSKFYYNKGLVASGFNKINLEFNLGEFVAITGESGSGKSTLLNVISGLDSYEEGEMYINGEETSHYGESEFEVYRKTYIGNIFQSFNLVNSYTVYQNIELVLLLNGYKKKDIKKKILDLIKEVDLYRYRNTRVSKLSGGQKQRVAIARALAKDTPIIIADEPTGNLDSKSAASVLKTLHEVSKDKLVIVVTHNYEQIEKYVTRKIEMHDGKVREDINLKKYEIPEIKVNDYGDIHFLSKIRIGIRNAFNIIPKFVLMFIVFLFVIAAFLFEYASSKQLDYDESILGYNYYFNDLIDNRMIVTKKDRQIISEDEINLINNHPLVEKIIENDLILDYSFNLNNDDYYYYGYIKKINEIDKSKVVGALPKALNEIVIGISSYQVTEAEKVLGKTLSLSSNSIINNDIKIVGYITEKGYDNNFYFTEEGYEEISKSIKGTASKSIITINNEQINYFQVYHSKKLSSSQVILNSEYNYLCNNLNCKNKKLDLKVEDVFYEKEVKLNIIDTFNKKNFKNYTDIDYTDEYYNYIIISDEDYETLYKEGPYQISVYAFDAHENESLKEDLVSKGFDVMLIRDTLNNEMESISGIIRIFKLIILIILYVVLFFVSYLVIKLIQKSKNIYYATVRILGGSRDTIKKLISIELYSIFHLTFILVIAFAILVETKVLSIPSLYETLRYLSIKDYLIIYLLLLIMSALISRRYAKKLFKSSAMKAYREEV